MGNSAVDRGGMDDGMGNSVDDGSSVVGGGSMDDGSSMVCGCNSMGDSLRVGSSTVIGDLSNVAVVRVGVVVHVLDAAVRESNRVRSLSVAGTIIGLGGVEVGSRVVVSNGVVVGVGRDLIGENLSGAGGISGGCMGNHGGIVGRGGVNHGGDSMSNRVGDNSVGQTMSNNTVPNSSVGKAMPNNTMADTMSDKTMSNNSMAEAVSNNTVGDAMSDESMSKVRAAVGNVRGVVDSSHVGTESLGLGGGPVLSLEGLAHRLVGHLSGTTSHMSNISDMAS